MAGDMCNEHLLGWISLLSELPYADLWNSVGFPIYRQLPQKPGRSIGLTLPSRARVLVLKTQSLSCNLYQCAWFSRVVLRGKITMCWYRGQRWVVSWSRYPCQKLGWSIQFRVESSTHSYESHAQSKILSMKLILL